MLKVDSEYLCIAQRAFRNALRAECRAGRQRGELSELTMMYAEFQFEFAHMCETDAYAEAFQYLRWAEQQFGFALQRVENSQGIGLWGRMYDKERCLKHADGCLDEAVRLEGMAHGIFDMSWSEEES